MGRIIAWLVLIFVVLLAVRVMSRRARARQPGGVPAAAEPMVRCARCGVFLPRTEAKQSNGGYVCATDGCAPHG